MIKIRCWIAIKLMCVAKAILPKTQDLRTAKTDLRKACDKTIKAGKKKR